MHGPHLHFDLVHDIVKLRLNLDFQNINTDRYGYHHYLANARALALTSSSLCHLVYKTISSHVEASGSAWLQILTGYKYHDRRRMHPKDGCYLWMTGDQKLVAKQARYAIEAFEQIGRIAAQHKGPEDEEIRKKVAIVIAPYNGKKSASGLEKP